MDEHFL